MPRPKEPLRRRPQADPEAEVKRLRAQLDDRMDGLEKQALRTAQAEVEVSRERYAQLYDFAPVGFLTLDRNGLICALNLTAANLLGQRREYLIGRPFQALLASPARRRFLQHLSRLRRGQVYVVDELEAPWQRRPSVFLQVISVAHRERGVYPPRFETALMDITQRRRAEARSAALAKLGLALNAAAWPAEAAQAVVDTALELCGWDACFLQVHDPETGAVTDLVTMDTIEGRRVPVPAMPQGRPTSPLVRQVMEKGAQLVLRQSADEQGPLTMRFGDASRPSLSLMFVPVRFRGQGIGVLSVQSYQRNTYTPQHLETLQGLADHVAGALARMRAVGALQRLNDELEARVAVRTAELRKYRDHLEELVKERTRELQAANEKLRLGIASRQVAEQALLSLAEDLRRSNQELEQFAYAASHDLQEPLRAIGGYVRLLEQRFPDKLDAKAREYIQGAAEGAIRMEQQITDLLALSRVGVREPELAEASLGAPLQAALRNLQFTISNAKARVTNDPLPTLRVDANQIAQLFQNLIANAIKFRGERSPEIHIGARADDRRWVVSVRDNGIGIEPQYFERIFYVFQRLHTRKKYPGTGIGLSICKKIVERHGGKIWVESKPGKGSTFYFSLPQTPARQEERTSNI